MNLFGKRPPDDVPGWAATMGLEDFERFIQSVETSIKKRDIEPVIHRDEGYWTTPDRPGKEYGLHGLIRTCATANPAEWAEIIEDHLERVLAVDTSQLPKDFDSVKDKIKIRLLPTDAHLPFDVVKYPVSEQFLTVLAIDRPQMISLVTEDTMRSWPTAKPQLYDLALQNVWEQNQPQLKPFDPHMPGIVEFEGDDSFVATHVLMLDRHLKPPKAGALVIVPGRDVAFVYAIEDRQAAKAIGILIRLADDIYRQHTGPVSPSLLWWRDGTFTHLPWEPMGERVNFTPPPDFVEMMKRLD